VELEWDPIEKIVKDGVILKSGKHVPLDVIVAATGFETVSMLCSAGRTHDRLTNLLSLDSSGSLTYHGARGYLSA